MSRASVSCKFASVRMINELNGTVSSLPTTIMRAYELNVIFAGNRPARVQFSYRLEGSKTPFTYTLQYLYKEHLIVFSVADDWCAELDSALAFLAGERGPHPDDYVPYLQFMPESQVKCFKFEEF